MDHEDRDTDHAGKKQRTHTRAQSQRNHDFLKQHVIYSNPSYTDLHVFIPVKIYNGHIINGEMSSKLQTARH